MPGRRRVRRGRPAAAGALAALVVLGASCGHQRDDVARAEHLVQAGVSAGRSGDLAASIADLRAATGADPGLASAFYDLGVALEEDHQPGPAQAALQRAVALQPASRPALLDLGLVEEARDPRGALAVLQRLLRIDPNGPYVLYDTGQLLDRLGRAAQGHADLARARQLDPSIGTTRP